MNLKKEIREIPDYPKVGISFKDVTSLFKNKEALQFVTNSIVDNFKEKGITKVVGLEARGFVFGGAIANKLDAGFIPIRKKGKLPGAVISESYELEYGMDSVEMHSDALEKDDVILIHDDLLATGGTAVAALNLAKKCGVKTIYFSFICDLEFIDTPNKTILKEYETQVLVKYQ
ncbi:adenine phosphoribosyltransferase [Draconibacterium halophilum]|uniref:Adenine phosphoribosyltransferase n=1 Tax=Draconibacterium halophilum TaxID=2706887 RepID=A0A6C0R9G6_9BACT|nr:adenine phosphoribosyltransferase [Draconibacterium halophilum]QIA06536.1 adenine phosphoribosyltransferase [Draconibacterium halophilum]